MELILLAAYDLLVSELDLSLSWAFTAVFDAH